MERRKSVGIATCYHRNHNYGGQLQGFALRHVVESMGFDALLIPYEIDRWRYLANKLVHTTRPNLIRSLKGKQVESQLMREPTNIPILEARARAFDQFERTVPHTAVCTRRTLPSAGNTFDYYLTGSDQIWNPSGWNEYTLLDFVTDGIPKASYAASFGRTSLTPGESKRLRNSIGSFASISVREASGLRIAKSVSDRPVEVVLDPTMLLDAEDWTEALGLPRERFLSESYAFVYMVDKQNNHVEKILELCRRSGLEAVLVAYAPAVNQMAKGLAGKYFSISVPGWVHAARDASAIVTDSFHGTAFGLNFGKPLWVIRKEAETSCLYDDRQANILNLLGAGARLVNSCHEIPRLSQGIDAEVQKKLEIMRLKSRGFLSGFLEA